MSRESGTGSKPPSPESATRDAMAEIESDKTAKGTQGRTETNVDAASTSGDVPKIAAATEPKLSLRDRAGKVVAGLKSRLGAVKDFAADEGSGLKGRDETERAGKEAAERRKALGSQTPITSDEASRVSRSTAGREATVKAIEHRDRTAARATVDRSAKNIEQTTGTETSPKDVAQASETTGQIRDTGIKPREAADDLMTKFGPTSQFGAVGRRGARATQLTGSLGNKAAAIARGIEVSRGNQKLLPAAETKKDTPDVAGAFGSLHGRIQNTVDKQRARKVDTNKGAAGDQMDFGNIYRAAVSRRKVAARNSRRAPTGRG
ncbi:MAG TPA: hypothetical protein DCX27_05405 [Balneola sp.]|nr:hypothetical protein [Balneola sp.]